MVDTRTRLDVAFLFLFSCFLAGSLICLGIKKIRERKICANDGFLVISGLCTLLYVATPDSLSGGSFVSERLALFVICSLLFWLSPQGWNTFHKRIAIWAATVVVVLGLISEVRWRASVAHFYDAFEEGAKVVEPGSTVLSLCYCNPESNSAAALSELRPWVLLNAGALTALKSHSALLYNYEAIGNVFPVIYQADFYERLPLVTLRTLVRDMCVNPQLFDLSDFERRAETEIEYVLLWGGPSPDDPKLLAFPLYQQLRTNYQLVFSSSPPGQLRIFRRLDAHRLSEKLLL